jgi:hypothetical protein
MNKKSTMLQVLSYSMVGILLEPPPPSATTDFFMWFFLGNDYRGLGGWVYFFLIALAAVIWVMYDSSNRRLPALGWRMGVIITAALLIPTVFYRFTVPNLTALDIPLGASSQEIAEILAAISPLATYAEPIFYLGVLGGVLPFVLAIGYYVTFQGLKGCPRGIHGSYEAVFGQCPECARMDMPPTPIIMQRDDYVPHGQGRQPAGESVAPPPPTKRKVQAWLVAGNGKSYQLCERETTIGRLSSNDIYLTGDNTLSRQHAKIVDQGGHFKLYDLGSKGLTRVNGRTVREPVLLETDDEIKFGDNTVLRFKK